MFRCWKSKSISDHLLKFWMEDLFIACYEIMSSYILIFLFLVFRSIKWYVGHRPRGLFWPPVQEVPKYNVSWNQFRSPPLNHIVSCVKGHQIVCRSWALGVDPDPSWTRSSKIFWKRLRSPPLHHIFLVSCVKGYQMVCMSWDWGRSWPLLNRKFQNILKTIEIFTYKLYSCSLSYVG